MRVLEITKTTYRVTDFLSWQRARNLTLSPAFQRRDVWPPAAKSYFIDTVVRGLPSPIIYLRERTNLKTLEPQREVVDGQQRLRTLLAFIEPTCLPDFKKRDAFVVSHLHNEEIAGKSFSELNDAMRKRIVNYELSVHILPPGTDDREVLEMFARLNSTGVRLNGQELRNARFFGELKQAAYEMAYEQLTRWRQWTIFNESDIARMAEVELVSEFIQLMIYGLTGRTQKALDNLYKEYDAAFPEEKEIRRRLHAVMDATEDTVGTQLPSLDFSNVTWFHTLFTHVYDLLFGLESDLSRKRAAKLPRNFGSRIARASNLIATEEFPDGVAKALIGRTTHLSTRETRLNFLREVFRRGAP